MSPEQLHPIILAAVARANASRDEDGKLTPEARTIINVLKRMLTDEDLQQKFLGDESLGISQQAQPV